MTARCETECIRRYRRQVFANMVTQHLRCPHPRSASATQYHMLGLTCCFTPSANPGTACQRREVHIVRITFVDFRIYFHSCFPQYYPIPTTTSFHQEAHQQDGLLPISARKSAQEGGCHLRIQLQEQNRSVRSPPHGRLPCSKFRACSSGGQQTHCSHRRPRFGPGRQIALVWSRRQDRWAYCHPKTGLR